MSSPKSYAVVLVGCGKMGGAMLQGWLKDGLAADQVLVIDPHANGLADGVRVVQSPDEIEDGVTGEMIILAVKPQVMADVVPSYARLGANGGVFVSVAAGKTVGFLKGLLGEDSRVIRAMPNTPAAVGVGATGAYASAGVTPAQKDTCHKLLSSSGVVVWVDREDLIDAVTAVSGSGPAYIFHMVEAMTQAAISLGLPAEAAETLARQTVYGAGQLMIQSGESAEQLRVNVSSPGGTTVAALSVLMDQQKGLPSLMDQAMKACANRARELAG